MTFAAFMALPVLFSSYLLSHIIIAKKSTTWPSTKGKLLQFKVDERTMKAKFPSLMEDSKFCILNIKYKYEVNGKPYHGSRIQFGKADAYITPEQIAQSEFYSKIQKDNFLVYYSKNFPSISTLMPGLSNTKNHIFGIGFIMFFGAFVYLMYVIAQSVIQNTAK